ncbi:alpha/beta hydrolase fold [Teratosphaeria destructans]|uniref:alcohol O-acetyltransferase n=1 Tax=Teratosphaeria destructans TaxID=418781 RepID=A0A9W7SX37_9PEZI|nr:alpha/beta hydrolase fold [Teratosphaeria destructans]
MAGLLSSLFCWPGANTITFTHSEEPLILPTKTGPKRTLSEIAKDSTPPCNLNPFLWNGHLQTAYTAVKYPGPAIHYKRRTFEQEDPAFQGHFTVDFVVAPPNPKDEIKGAAEDGQVEDKGLREDPMGVGHTRSPPRTTYFTNKEFENIGSDDTKPLLITLHGLSGGSYEVYLRHVLAPLVEQSAKTSEQAVHGLSGGEWEALVINSRGCAGSKITSSMMYNARATWDMRMIVKWCRKTWPNRPLFAVGYSLGANILTNYIGEEGKDCLLSAAVVVSNPWKLEVSNAALQRTYLGREVYSKAMGNHMRKLFETHREQILKNKALSEGRILKLKYLYEFDREVQCATWGYPTEGAYYRDASSSDSILAVRIPLLALHAIDDPIAADEAVPYEEIRQNPYTVMVATSGGGHLAWYEFGGGRWHAKPIVNFLNAMAREVDFEKMEHPEPQVHGPKGGHQTPFAFGPMRRRAHVVGSSAFQAPTV